MKVCICDSVEKRRALKQKMISDYFAESETDCEVIVFTHAQALLLSKDSEDADIFVIDTAMGDAEGMAPVRELQQRYHNKIYLLTSDNYNHLDEAMDLGVTRYLLNGAGRTEFYSALDRAVEEINKHILVIKGRKGGLYRLHKSDIVFVEAKERRTLILTPMGRIETNIRISKMKQILNTPNFIYPHYSFIVNNDYISHMEGKDIFVKVNYCYTRVPIAAKKVSATKKQLTGVNSGEYCSSKA